MNEKEKQIKELTQEIEFAKKGLWNAENLKKEDYSWHSRGIAVHLFDIGYTKNKIPEGSVVLSKEEYQELEELRLNHAKDLINANKLLDKYPTDKIEKVSMDPAQALYTYEFITAEDKDYSRRWKNILKMMDNDGRLYFEGNFFYSLNTTLDLLKQIDSACSIMLKKGTDTDKAEMYETLAYNAKCAIRLLQIPPLNESFN